MKDFKVGDKVIVVKTDYPQNVPIGTKGVVSSLAGNFPRIKVGCNYEWIFSPKELELIYSESTTKKIKQSLLRLYLSDTNKTIKSEKIIDYVKQEIGTEYIFGDTILRALRQLRQDGKLDYIIDGAKQDRNYKFKAV
jgi:hypothetical protein